MTGLEIMAIVAVASAGYNIVSGEQQKTAAAKAERDGINAATKAESDLVAEQHRRRMQQQQGQTDYSGSVSAQQMAAQGTMLTSTPTTRSLLGGT